MSMPKNCIFCGQRARSKEHIFGKWPRKLYPEYLQVQARAVHQIDRRDENGQKFIARGRFGAGYNPVYSTAKLVCKICNNTWMSEIEDKMRMAFEATFYPNQDAHLSAETVATIIYWSYLKNCLHEAIYSPESVFDERYRPAASMIFGDLSSMEASYLENWLDVFSHLYSRFRSTRAIPKDTRFYVSRCQINPQAITGLTYARKRGAAFLGDQIFVARAHGKNECVLIGDVIQHELKVQPNAFVSAIFLGHFQIAVTSVYDAEDAPAPNSAAPPSGIVELRLGECAELPVELSLRPDAFERMVFKYCTDNGIAWRSSF